MLAQIGLIYLAMALQQKGSAWSDGSALYYGLNSERWVSAAGAAARHALGPSALAAWTRAFRLSELAIPALIFLPFAWRLTRGVAIGLVLFTGLTLGVFFSFGPLGWTLVASAALLIPPGTWDRIEEHPRARRARTVVYDADCGVCLLLCRLLKRLDLRGNLTFQGNDDLDGLDVRAASGAIERRALPAAVTAELVSGHGGHRRSRRPGVHPRPRGGRSGAGPAARLADRLGDEGCRASCSSSAKLYDFIAARRMRISVAIGKEACGIADHERAAADHDASALAPRELTVPPPSTRLRRGVIGIGREVAVAVVFAAALAQSCAVNDLPWRLPQPPWLAAVAAWPRMLARWDVLATPPTEDEVMVIDAQTKGGRSVDPLTGKEPELDPGAMRGTGLGQLWNEYLWRIRQREWFDYQRAFRDYLSKGGPAWDDPQGDNQLVGLDAYWLKQPIPAPGEPRQAGVSARDKVFTQARGGRLAQDKKLPLLRPELPKR